MCVLLLLWFCVFVRFRYGRIRYGTVQVLSSVVVIACLVVSPGDVSVLVVFSLAWSGPDRSGPLNSLFGMPYVSVRWLCYTKKFFVYFSRKTCPEKWSSLCILSPPPNQRMIMMIEKRGLRAGVDSGSDLHPLCVRENCRGCEGSRMVQVTGRRLHVPRTLDTRIRNARAFSMDISSRVLESTPHFPRLIC